MAIFGVIAGFSYYVLTVRANQRNQQHQLETRRAQLYMTLFNTINNQNLWKHVVEIRQYEYTDYDDFMQKYGPIENPEAYNKLTKVWWFFTELGTLVYRGYITLDDCSHLMSSTPLEIWSQFQTAIEGLRQHYYRSGTGYLTFEYLAKMQYQSIETRSVEDNFGILLDSIPSVIVPPLSEFEELSKDNFKDFLENR